jgi:hypothetical protein
VPDNLHGNATVPVNHKAHKSKQTLKTQTAYRLITATWVAKIDGPFD